VRRKRLTKELGGVNAVKRASLDELRSIPWLPESVAEALYAKLHDPRPAPPSREARS
jgi:excinuclease ABC subunit C